MDTELNRNVKDLPADVATEDSSVRVLVIKTNEELAIAEQTYGVLTQEASTAKGSV